MAPVQIDYFSDVLCVWAYVAHRRVVELAETFGARIAITTRYCSVFSDAWRKIEGRWGAEGGFEAFSAHLQEAVRRYPHVELNARVWTAARPRSSAPAHLFLKALEQLEQEGAEEGAEAAPYLDRLAARAAWDLRRAFFVDAVDIFDWRSHRDVAQRLGVDYDHVVDRARTAEAAAALATDYDLAHAHGVAGSPTFILNDGRQKLFGDVGYRLLEANVEELLRAPPGDTASWC